MNEDLKSLATQLPKVIEEGKEVIRPDVIQAVTQLAQLGQLVKIRRSLAKQEFRGKLDPRTLNATDREKIIDLIDGFPNYPWISAYFFNDGPDAVYISINRADEIHEVEYGESYSVDFSSADKRIEIIYYKCDTDETASLRVVGKY